MNEAKKPLVNARRSPFNRGPNIDGDNEGMQSTNANHNPLPLATPNNQASIIQDISQNQVQRFGTRRLLQSAGGDMTRENNFAISGMDPQNPKDFSSLTYIEISGDRIKI